jgi:TetR/AcrR family acrAB operon transcriptional repressor
MVRKTKAEAQITRSHILDAAEQVFGERGVSGTSLHEIAQSAGLTRGAIYWHFKDKADLFNAMMERVTLPLEEPGGLLGQRGTELTLAQLRDSLVDVLKRVVADPQVRRVFDIAIHKVEYVGEMTAVRDRHLSVRNDCVGEVEHTLRRALARGELSSRLPVATVAIGLHALLDGLLQNWMLDPLAFDLVQVGDEVIDNYLSSLAADSRATHAPVAKSVLKVGPESASI